MTEQAKLQYRISEYKRVIRKYGKEPVGSMFRDQAERSKELLKQAEAALAALSA